MSSLPALRVLDLSEGVSGSYCTKLLADHGAEVIKVERPGSGDPIRRHGPFTDDLPHPEKGALFLYLNTNKKSITLDLGQETGALIFRRLVLQAEVVVESYRPGYLDELGLGHQELSCIKPRLVMTSITPFGQSGPYASYRATNLTALAMGGQICPAGEPDRQSLKSAGYQADHQVGLHAFAATAVAAVSADASEVGQHIDLSALECLASAPELYLPLSAQPTCDASQDSGKATSGGHVRTIQELLKQPQRQKQGCFRQIDHPAAGRLTYPGPPFRASGLPWQGGRAPLLGEHNEEIYCGELGLSRQELALLRASGIV